MLISNRLNGLGTDSAELFGQPCFREIALHINGVVLLVHPKSASLHPSVCRTQKVTQHSCTHRERGVTDVHFDISQAFPWESFSFNMFFK